MKYTLTLVFALLMGTLCAQSWTERKDFDLQADYGLSNFQQNLTLANVGTVTQNKAKFPALFAHLNGRGWTDGKVQALNVFVGCWNDAFLRGFGGGQPVTSQWPKSANGITAPAGTYAVNYPCYLDAGNYIGKGTGYGGTAQTVAMNTTLVLNRAGWQGDNLHEMHLMRTTTWGSDAMGSIGYTESGTLDGFGFIGDRGTSHNTSYTSAGVALWDIGETWRVGRIYPQNFNGYGVLLVRGTPGVIDYLSTFNHTIAGIGIIGAALNTVNIGTLSGDDSPTLVYIRPGYNREGGCALNVGLTKCESGKRGNAGQIILDAVGYVSAHFHVVQAGNAYSYADALFVIDSRGRNSSLTVDQLRAWNYRTIVQDVKNGKRMASGGDYLNIARVTWNSEGAGIFQSIPQLPVSTCNCPGRLGVAVWNGSSYPPHDYNNCTPAYDPSATPIFTDDDCLWAVGPWVAGPCVNGKTTMTREVTAPAGCTPTLPQPLPSMPDMDCEAGPECPDCPEAPPCPDCPECPQCPDPEPCPPPVPCPDPEPCPDPVPCPDCPECPDPPVDPEPPVDPPDPEPEPPVDPPVEPEPEPGVWVAKCGEWGRCRGWSQTRTCTYVCEGGVCDTQQPAPTTERRFCWGW